MTNAIATPGTVVDSHGNPFTTARTESYSYDELNRLSAVNYGDGETQSYGFDAMGNRLVKMDATASGTTTTTSAYDLANRLTAVGGASYVNDADGNTLSGGGRTMTWDSQNRMVSCSYNGNTLAFDYGSDGLRRSETLTSGGQSVTTYYVYDGQSLVMEETKNAQGVLTPSASYLNGPRGPEYKKDETTGLVKWYLYDGLGSVVGEVDPAGTVVYSAKYDVYGAVRGTTGTATMAQGFVGGLGHLSEAATGLIYMRARYYDPNTGRFLSEDISKNGVNWFEYGADNPVNYVDMTGCAALDFMAFMALIGRLTNAASANAIQAVANYCEQLANNFDRKAALAKMDAVGYAADAQVAEALEDDADAANLNARAGKSLEDAATSSATAVFLREVAALILVDADSADG